MSKYLIVVEGQKTEFELIKQVTKRILPNYSVSFTQYKGQQTIKFTNIKEANDEIFVIKPKHNRLSQIVEDYKKENGDIFAFQMYFDQYVDPDFFEKIFFIFDVDYTSDVDLSFALEHFNDEYSSGFLIISSPCIEAMTDTKKTYCIETEKHISDEYKPKIHLDALKRFDQYVNLGYNALMCGEAFGLLNKCLIDNLSLFDNDQQFMNHQAYFKNSFLPFIESDFRHYPLVTSFIYVLIGSILNLDVEENPSASLSLLLEKLHAARQS